MNPILSDRKDSVEFIVRNLLYQTYNGEKTSYRNLVFIFGEAPFSTNQAL